MTLFDYLGLDLRVLHFKPRLAILAAALGACTG
jgi:hypothetical protein